MATRRDATPRTGHPTSRSASDRAAQPRRSGARQGSQDVSRHSAAVTEQGSRTASSRTRAADSCRRSAQGGQERRQGQTSGQARRKSQRSRQPSRRGGIDFKVIGIVVVSLAVVLGVAGFFAQRRGLLDWTGIGMRKVAVDVRADEFDDASTPLPLHVEGTRSSGVEYERDFYITAGQESISLPQGSYTAEVVASPIGSGGVLFSIPAAASSVTIEDRSVQVSGNSTGTLVLDLDHLDIIDATDAQVDAAIAAAQASSGKKASEVVEHNVPALQRLRQQSVLPDDMPESLVLESTMSGWATTVSVLADGSFTGTYTQLVSSATGSDYPNGTAYTCTFSGKFTDVERIGESGFRMTLGEVELDHEVGEKWVEDGVLNVGAQPLGFETGSTFELWRPGTPTAEFGWWLSAWCNDYATAGVPDELDRWALDNVDASYGFFSEGPKPAAAADDAAGTDDEDATSTSTSDSTD